MPTSRRTDRYSPKNDPRRLHYKAMKAERRLRYEGIEPTNPRLREEFDLPPLDDAHDRVGRRPVARIAECPTHGLHGERERCFECAAPVRRPVFVAGWVSVVVAGVAVVVGVAIGVSL